MLLPPLLANTTDDIYIGGHLLSPPDGDVNTIDDIVAKLKTFGASLEMRHGRYRKLNVLSGQSQG